MNRQLLEHQLQLSSMVQAIDHLNSNYNEIFMFDFANTHSYSVVFNAESFEGLSVAFKRELLRNF